MFMDFVVYAILLCSIGVRAIFDVLLKIKKKHFYCNNLLAGKCRFTTICFVFHIFRCSVISIIYVLLDWKSTNVRGKII